MRNIELAYLLVAYAMAAIMFYVTRHSKFPTLSHVALGTRLARQTFFWGLLSAGILYWLLVRQWFVPHFGFGRDFEVLTIVLVVGQALTGLFPVEHKRLSALHVVFGSIMAACMFVTVAVLAASPAVHDGVRIVNSVLIAGMIATVATTRWTRRATKQLVAHEFVFFGLWHLAIFITAYLG